MALITFECSIILESPWQTPNIIMDYSDPQKYDCNQNASKVLH